MRFTPKQATAIAALIKNNPDEAVVVSAGVGRQVVVQIADTDYQIGVRGKVEELS